VADPDALQALMDLLTTREPRPALDALDKTSKRLEGSLFALATRGGHDRPRDGA